MIKTILLSRFKSPKKPYPSFLQIEVLIALGLLVVSVSVSSYGLAMYQKQSHQLRTQLFLADTVRQLAEQMDAKVEYWNIPSFFQHLPPVHLQQFSVDLYSQTFQLTELQAVYELQFSNTNHSPNVYAVMAKKNIVMDVVLHEQVFFVCFSRFREQWMHASTFRTYDLP